MSYRETNRAGQTVRKWEFHVIKSCWSFSACTAPSKSAFARARHSLRVSQHEHHEPRARVVKEFHFTMRSGDVCVLGYIFVHVFGILYGLMEKNAFFGVRAKHTAATHQQCANHTRPHGPKLSQSKAYIAILPVWVRRLFLGMRVLQIVCAFTELAVAATNALFVWWLSLGVQWTIASSIAQKHTGQAHEGTQENECIVFACVRIDVGVFRTWPSVVADRVNPSPFVSMPNTCQCTSGFMDPI